MRQVRVRETNVLGETTLAVIPGCPKDSHNIYHFTAILAFCYPFSTDSAQVNDLRISETHALELSAVPHAGKSAHVH